MFFYFIPFIVITVIVIVSAVRSFRRHGKIVDVIKDNLTQEDEIGENIFNNMFKQKEEKPCEYCGCKTEKDGKCTSCGARKN